MPIEYTIPEDANAEEIKPGAKIVIEDDVVTGAGFIPRTELNDKYVSKVSMENTIKERLNQQARSLKDEFKDDPAFVRDILVSKNVPLDDDGNVAIPDQRKTAQEMQATIQSTVNQHKKAWEDEVAKPLRSQLEEASATIGNLRKKQLHGEILRVAKQLEIRDSYFDSLPDAPPETIPIIAQTAFRFGLPEGSEQFAVKNGDGGFVPDAHSTNPDQPWLGVAGYFQSLKADPVTRKKYFKDERPTDVDTGDKNYKDQNPDDLSPSQRAAQLESRR